MMEVTERSGECVERATTLRRAACTRLFILPDAEVAGRFESGTDPFEHAP